MGRKGTAMDLRAETPEMTSTRQPTTAEKEKNKGMQERRDQQDTETHLGSVADAGLTATGNGLTAAPLVPAAAAAVPAFLFSTGSCATLTADAIFGKSIMAVKIYVNRSRM